MHLDDVLAPRTRVEQVDVLRHDRLDETASFELGERVVRRVRPSVTKHVNPFTVEGPYALGIAPESLDRGHLKRIDLRPDSGRGAEVGYAGLRGDPSTGEHDARLALADEGR